MEVNGIELAEEKRVASYLVYLVVIDLLQHTMMTVISLTPFVTKSKKFNAPSTSIPGVSRNSNVSRKTKSAPERGGWQCRVERVKKPHGGYMIPIGLNNLPTN
ncbi:Uncharacterized protein Adt_41134 [Abeliophyllum distichum]|uniref:Uncharacterized protein n=1 Tax=Abeliophyllum distichum TaxID=126358 RepID=A0ABD1PN02_9LAMI